VKKGQTSSFTLCFKPTNIGRSEGKLLLVNPVTYDQYEYKLVGFTEEPIATDNLVIQCQAKKTVTQQIPVTNKTMAPITYIVETDLINPEGPRSITVPAMRTMNYELKLTPKLGGTYTGKPTTDFF